MSRFIGCSLLSFILFLCTACITKVYETKKDNIFDGKYDSEYPYQPVSNHLEHLVESIHMVNVLAFYESLEFDYADRITNQSIIKDQYRGRVVKRQYFQKPATGTATLVYYRQKRIAMLTCAHILDFPDTLYSYYKEEDGQITDYVHTVAIKTKQNNQIIEIPEMNDFEILVLDQDKDIALIGKRLLNPISRPLAVFDYPDGKAAELNWGTVVYVAGHPRGKKMISTSLVSGPSRDKSHAFLIDAAFPRGISGGIVLAIRDGIPNFELVGMINAVAAESRYILAPEKEQNLGELDLLDTYRGKIYIDNFETLFYGVTYVISIEAINTLLHQHKPELDQKGYFQELFFSGNGIEYVSE